MSTLSDQQLRQKLEEHGFDPGPFSETTRSYWLRKLSEVERKAGAGKRPQPQAKLFSFSSDDDSYCVNSSRKRKKSKRRKVSEQSDSTDEPDYALDVAQRRADAMSRVHAAGNKLLDDIKKTHLRDRLTPWYFRYSLHVLVSAIVFVAALLMLRAMESPVDRAMAGSREELIWCNYSSIQSEQCKELPRIERAINLTYYIASIADERAGQAACNGLHTGEEQLSHTLKSAELHKIATAWENKEQNTSILVDALRLMIANSHWQLVVMTPTSHVVYTEAATESDKLQTAVVVSTNPRKPLLCRMRAAFVTAARHFVIVAVCISCILLVFVGLRKYAHQQEKARQEIFALIDQILALLRRQYNSYQKGEEAVPYVAISHVRDILLSPSKRQQLSYVWEHATDWIKQNESRVRTETRRIAGEDYLVWRWIDIESDSSLSKGVASPANSPIANSAVAEKLKRREEMWGEHVLDHYSSEACRQQLVPLQERPSCCLKLHNLFVPSVCSKADEFEELEACVLHKLTQHGQVLHCFLDRWSDEGAFYAKLDRVASATSVIEALHGTWFGRRLVKAEYISLAEYSRLFPSSRTASKILFPT